jgi:hypothetical protein
MEEWRDDDERASVDGPVPAKTTWQDWLKTQPPKIQESILGKYRYEAWKNGADIKSFVVDGRQLSLAQLQKIEGISFYKTLSPAQREEIQRQSDTVYNRLTRVQKTSLSEYTTSEHKHINGALYGIEPMTPFIKDSISNIEAAMDKFAVENNMSVYSGTNKKHYENWKVGEIKTIEGYLSTSITKKHAELFYKREEKMGNIPLMLEVRVPTGARGLYIGDNTGFKQPQNEFLLGKGLQYRVIDNTGEKIILEIIK